ncbi:MAG: NifX-associated nitrogen fixation protein [Alphaproteobacteria bacterium]|nr:NifX-associated nitrogen fixation protein [Alphaproteobacteria bacterium]MBF0249400.1 NifX-associated nitrogen fixation protein [Alphaproteobacteria bacterium]
MTTDAVIDPNDPVLQSDFIKEMVRQIRAIDSYGVYDTVSDAEVLDPLVLTKERKRAIPVVGDPDEETLARVKAFYNAIAAQTEAECGKMAMPMINISHEGFGRAIITVGKLVVMDRSLRDVHRFGFPSLSKMKDEADKLLSVATSIIGEHPDAAGM